MLILLCWCITMNKKDIISAERLKLAEKKILSLIPMVEQIVLSQEFIRGVTIGLFYGIVGNIIVLHYHRAFERLMTGQFDVLLWANVIVFIVAFASIVVLSIRWHSKLGKLEKRRHAIFEAAEMLGDYYRLMKEGKEKASE